MTPLVQRMVADNLIIDYTNTANLTNSQRVSLSLDATGTNKFLTLKRLYFLSGFNLNYQTITGISIDTSNYTLSKDPINGKTVPTYDDLSHGYLVLVNALDKITNTIPLTDLVTAVNGGKIFRTNLENINFGASYVQFFPASSLDSTFSLPFTFHFL